MAANLSVGINEKESDKVFLRTFSILVLHPIIALDDKSLYLDKSDIHRWLEQGLDYFKSENDLRGHVPQKGWAHAMAHAMAHAGDFFLVISANRFLGAEDLKRILDAIADKLTAPAGHAFVYQEDERMALAVMSALLRNLLDMDFLSGWLDRFVIPKSGIDWKEAFAEAANAKAKHNTVLFLRSLYFQLLFGIQFVHPSYVDKTPKVRDELLAEIEKTLLKVDSWVYKSNKTEG